MELKHVYSFRVVVAVICALVISFCLFKYFEPAEALQYQISGYLNIPSINLDTDVTTLELKDGKLDTPATIVGSYSRHKNTTLLIGHSNSVFTGLKNIKIGDEVNYNGSTFKIYKSQIITKDAIDMKSLLSESKNETIVLMTCFGQMYADGDASHRLIIFASLI